MTLIRFLDEENEKRGLAYLLGRFPGRTWADGRTMVPAEALAHLAEEGIRFSVEGRPDYQSAYEPLRDPAAFVIGSR